MSVQRQSTTETCKYCDNRIHDYFSPGYCSPLCYYKYHGQKLLNTIQHDHRWCTNCGRRLKEVEAPTQEQLKAIDGLYSTKALEDGGGYQYRTPNAGVGEITIQSERGERVTTGTICDKCGNTSHHTEFPEDRDRHLLEYGERILSTLEDKEQEHNKDISRSVFFDMLLDTEDLVFALGKAVE